jgi:hypothetical protein
MMRLERMLVSFLGVLWAVVGCDGPTPQCEPLRMGLLEVFVQSVAPHVEARCAQGGCHGRPERLLSLYAPGVHREDPERRYLDEPLSPEELAENARRLAAFAQVPDPRDSLLLCKPLARSAGGCWHGGGDNFHDDTDPAYGALLGWMRDAPPPDGGLH